MSKTYGKAGRGTRVKSGGRQTEKRHTNLSQATEIISWIAVCRWSMEGYGTTANLNDLPLRLQQEGVMIPHEAESFFEFTVLHLLASWGILVLYTVVFLALARVVLSKVGKEKS